MKNPLADRSKLLLNALLLIAFMAMTGTGRAIIVGPYNPDAFTLHLWHIDETAVPVHDFGTNTASNYGPGGNLLVNLGGLLNGATLSNQGFPGFGTCVDTRGVSNSIAWLNGTPVNAGLFPTTTTTAATTMSYIGTNGAFTMEALICPLFPVTTNFGTLANGGTGRGTINWQLMAGESGTASNRVWQFRFDPIGVLVNTAGQPATGNTQPLLDFITFSSASTTIEVVAPIPTNGPNAIASNQWYHVAVTYNGQPNTPGNMNFYWTLMSSNTSVDNLILSTNLTAGIYTPYSKPSFAIGNTGRSDNGNWLGLIDEVRMSSIARNAVGMMFTPVSVTFTTEPPTNTLAGAGDTVSLPAVVGGGGTITYQWMFNGTNLPVAGNPTVTNATLVLTNITTNQAGNYVLIAGNGSSSATSTVANVQVGGVIGLFNTGVDDHGNLLPGDALDPHWQLVQSADPSYPGPNTFTITSPVAAWLPNGPNSKWIAPADGPNIAAGQFTYGTTFFLDTLDPSNSQITGSWISDNQGQDILLNGVSLGITNSTSLGSYTSFVITNGFVSGPNTLQLVIANNAGGGNNPSGLRAELHGVGLSLPPTAPQLVSSPTNISTESRQTAIFSVGAFGSAPLTYQWYFGATPLAGQTGRNLVLANLNPNQSGTYSVIVSNNISTTNASATLSVIAPPAVAWLGTNGPDWDTTTINWLDTGSLANVAFLQGDDVIFDDQGSGSPNVDLIGTLTPNSILVSSSNNYTLSSDAGGSLAGTFTLTKAGTGTLILDTLNTYNGNTIISNGTLQIGNADTSGTLGSGLVSNNAALVLDRFDTFFISSSISGTGSVAMIGSGQALLAGNNSYTGPTIVAAGQLNPRSSTALGTADSGTTVMDGAQLYIDFGINFTNEPLLLGGIGINSDGALRKGGGTSTVFGGPITLSDFAGIQVDTGSVLSLTNAAAITSTNQNLAVQCLGNGQLFINGAINLGSGSVQELGAGTVVLAGTNNNWTGGTTISGGTLQIGDGGNDGSIGNGQIEDDTILAFSSSGNVIFTNIIVGGGVVNQIGTGQVTLSGANSYGGGTHINGLGSMLVNNSSALGTGTITVGSGQLDISVLKLSGGITLNNQLAIFPRAFGVVNNGVLNPADFLNLDGTNILAPPSPIVIPSGGNLLTLESDGGDLILNGGVTAAGVGRDFVMQGTASGEVLGPISLSGGNNVFVWKLGTGTWTLWGNNTPGQTTTVSNGTLIVNGSMDTNFVVVAGGTLGGTGTFAGPVTVSLGAKLAPTAGTAPIGSMTINNTLTLSAGSSTVLQLNESAGTNDEIIGLTNVTYGGNLVLSNLAGTIGTNDSFLLFSSTAYNGTFASITPAFPSAGLKWNTNTLATDGTLRVATLRRPAITGTSIVSTNKFVFSGSGGNPNDQYILLTSTNVTAHLSTWTPVVTNQFDANGNFSVTNTIAGTAGPRFFAVATH